MRSTQRFNCVWEVRNQKSELRRPPVFKVIYFEQPFGVIATLLVRMTFRALPSGAFFTKRRYRE